MPNSLTNKGEEYALKGDGSSDGGIARKGASLRLFSSATSPAKDGTGFTEIATGNGYAPISVTVSDWSYSVVSVNSRITCANKVWTASGSGIANIAGIFLADSGGLPLAWWERSAPTSLDAGDTVTAQGLVIELN